MGLNLKGMASGLGLGNLFGGNGGVGGGYLKTLVQEDFLTADIAVIVPGKWELLGEYTVPAQQRINVGYGDPSAEKNQGTVFVNIDTVGGVAVARCLVRVQVADANDVVKPGGVVMEERTEILSASTSRTEQVPLPEYGVAAGQDDKIQIWIKSDTATDVGYNAATPETEVKLPVTVRRG